MTVSLLERQQAFGAPGLLSMRRGAGYVPDISQNAGVPTNPPISLSQLAGAVKYQPISISGPGTLNFGPILVNRPPSTQTRAAGTSVSGGQGTLSVSWSHINAGDGATCSNTGAINPNFTAAGYVGNPPGSGSNETLSGVWRLTVSDGITSAQYDLTITVTREEP